jgi:hypothetical protein
LDAVVLKVASESLKRLVGVQGFESRGARMGRRRLQGLLDGMRMGHSSTAFDRLVRISPFQEKNRIVVEVVRLALAVRFASCLWASPFMYALARANLAFAQTEHADKALA